MKALSLWQPWATLIAIGAKRYETRSWATTYRGPLVICASKAWTPECRYAIRDLWIQKALADAGSPELVRGVAVCIVDLAICYPTDGFMMVPETDPERHFGDFSPGRFAWKLENVRRLHPFSVRGRQGLFDVQMPGEFPK